MRPPSFSRRLMLATGACSLAGLGSGRPHAVLAGVPTDRRLVVVILRGAMDGLAAVPPYADPGYRRLRGELAHAEHELLDLDGHFAMSPQLPRLHQWYRDGSLALVHAVASPYRERSHFDGQDLLESGMARPLGGASGWLNRAIAVMGERGRRLGLAIGPTTPLVLRGAAEVSTWTPGTSREADRDLLDLITDLYAEDATLGPIFMAGRQAQLRLAAAADAGTTGAVGDPAGQLNSVADRVGRLLAAPTGLRIAAIECNGWDTHAGQGTTRGRMARQLTMLDEALGALRTALGPAWRDTVVACITEFGRTVAANGSGGTDHGTASAAFLMGGAVNGGRVLGRWPGLRDAPLHQGRDLAPTTDLRAVLKAPLVDHLGLEPDAVERAVFPASGNAVRLRDLIV